MSKSVDDVRKYKSYLDISFQSCIVPDTDFSADFLARARPVLASAVDDSALDYSDLVYLWDHFKSLVFSASTVIPF